MCSRLLLRSSHVQVERSLKNKATSRSLDLCITEVERALAEAFKEYKTTVYWQSGTARTCATQFPKCLSGCTSPFEEAARSQISPYGVSPRSCWNSSDSSIVRAASNCDRSSGRMRCSLCRRPERHPRFDFRDRRCLNRSAAMPHPRPCLPGRCPCALGVLCVSPHRLALFRWQSRAGVPGRLAGHVAARI